ncbi:hypothetical protein FRB99_007320 [Tulasnella sp. 403]|nr:hypothetical protein FRB99_007320 [Tulasnella sp. 403]
MPQSGAAYLGVHNSWNPVANNAAADQAGVSPSSSRSSVHAGIAVVPNATSQRNRELMNQAFGKRDQPFAMSHGTRRHGLPKEIAPYPMCYDDIALNIDTVDHIALWNTRNGPSGFDFKEHPKRCLDVGCGHAVWIMQASRVWTESQFVGFDLVDIQPDLSLHPDVADRIQWVHGNFLTDPLPFEDGSFDYVYARALEMAVPEDQEIVRVLKPGGAVDFLFNDILFPYIPLTAEERKKFFSSPPSASRQPLAITPETQTPDHTQIHFRPSTQGLPPLSSYVLPPSTNLPSKTLYQFNNNIRTSSKTLTSRARKALTLLIQDSDPEGRRNGDRQPPIQEQTQSASGSGSSVHTSTSNASNTSETAEPFNASKAPPLSRSADGRPPSSHTNNAARGSLHLVEEEPPHPRHIHEWLENIFYAMFERRFINLNPTRILTSYMNIHFSAVTAGKFVRMPMPKLGTIYGTDDDDELGEGSTTGNESVEQLRSEPESVPEPPPPQPVVLPPSPEKRPSTPQTHWRSPSGSLKLQTTSLPLPSNPPSSSSARISPNVSPNIVVDEVDSTTDRKTFRSSIPSSTPATYSTISDVSTPPSSFAPSVKDAPGHTTAQPPPLPPLPDHPLKSPPASIFSARRREQLAGIVFDLQEHSMINSVPAEGVPVDSLATIPGRATASTSNPTAPPQKKNKKPLKFVLMGQSMTMMIVRAFSVVIACKEDMWDELLLQNNWRDVSKIHDPATKRSIARLRLKFDQAFDHYISDMRVASSLPDGLVHALHMHRPAKAPLTPAQEVEERLNREKQVEKALALLGRSYNPDNTTSPSSPMPDISGGPITDRRSGTSDQRAGSTSFDKALARPDPNDANQMEEEVEPAFFRSTRSFAGFKRARKTSTKGRAS